jgi:hypothetical protein
MEIALSKQTSEPNYKQRKKKQPTAARIRETKTAEK